MARILVVDDDPQIQRMVRAGLKQRGLDSLGASTGEEALLVSESGSPSLLILDLGLPDVDGTTLIREIRRRSSIPIIVLSGQEAEAKKVAALEAGADDFVTKPFGMDELIARVRANLRRAAPAEAPVPVMGFFNVEIDLDRRLVRVAGQPVHLTPTEFALLEALVRNPGKLLTHHWLLNRVWGAGYSNESQYLRVYVGQLREKLGDRADEPRFIATEARVGYRWIPDPNADEPSG